MHNKRILPQSIVRTPKNTLICIKLKKKLLRNQINFDEKTNNHTHVELINNYTNVKIIVNCK